MRPDAPYFIILLCLTPHDFTHQGESVATQLVACMSGSMLEIEPATEVNKKELIKTGFIRTNHMQNSYWSEINSLAL